MFDKEFSIAEEKLSNLEQEIKKLQEEKRDMEERLRVSYRAVFNRQAFREENPV